MEGLQYTCGKCNATWVEVEGRLPAGKPCEHYRDGGTSFERKPVGVHEFGKPDHEDATEEIPIQPDPAQAGARRPPHEVLKELQDRLGENHMPDFELAKLFSDPLGYLTLTTGSPFRANEIMVAIVKLYFQTLHAKATAGEDFGDNRLVVALKKARIVALEQLAEKMPQFSNENLLKTAELVSQT